MTPAITDWVADFDAPYHTTLDPSILSSSHPPLSSYPSSIIVGNMIIHSVTSVGDLVLP